jgi:hypothetical protein
MHKMNFLFLCFWVIIKSAFWAIPSSFYHTTKKVVRILIPPENYYSIMLLKCEYVWWAAARWYWWKLLDIFIRILLFIFRMKKEGERKTLKFFISFFFSLQDHKYFTTASLVYELFIFFSSLDYIPLACEERGWHKWGMKCKQLHWERGFIAKI